jgi:hypothetical protein
MVLNHAQLTIFEGSVRGLICNVIVKQRPMTKFLYLASIP